MFNSGEYILCLLKAVILLLKQYNKKTYICNEVSQSMKQRRATSQPWC